ncbi:MAG: carbohydrate-binding family 9-like protein [Planctomycetota bacterium]|nr:carbohydrate-binding family 9-like protein [Planctomycetota bacterium]
MIVATKLYADDEPKTDPVPEYTIHRAGTPITIDGKLDEPAWVAAPDVGAFHFTWYKEGDKERTVAKMLWDDENLYVGHICEDAHITARHTERDGMIPKDDCFEVMITPNVDHPEVYFNLEWNVIGGLVDNHRPNGPKQPRAPKWDAEDVQIAGTYVGTLNDDDDSDGYWIVEVAIPFKNFEKYMVHTPPEPGDGWNLNLNRHGGDVNLQYSQWSKANTPEPSFHTPDRFGRVWFSEKTSPFDIHSKRDGFRNLQSATRDAYVDVTVAMGDIKISTSTTEQSIRGEEWPGWRGPRGDGTWHGPNVVTEWPADGLKRLWRHEIGGGYAGISVSEDKVIALDRQTVPAEVERAICYDAESGDVLWTQNWPVTYGKLDYGNGPRAAPTIEGNLVYVQGAVGELVCLNLDDGAIVWSVNLIRDFQGRLAEWGYAASPLVYGKMLIVQPGGDAGKSVVALDRATGETIWASHDDKPGYTNPLVVDYGGYKTLLCWTPSHIRGMNPDTGDPFWNIEYEITYGVSIATPIFQEGIAFVAGYWDGARAIQFGERPPDAKLIWEDRKNLQGLMSQPLYRYGYAYLLERDQGLTCFELATGNKLWDDGQKLTPRGRNPQASLVWLGDEDRVIAFNSVGELVLCRLNPDGYHESSRTQILIPKGESDERKKPTWSHPAYAKNRVFVRDDEEIIAYELPTQ